jgi:transcription elongation factor Elf1
MDDVHLICPDCGYKKESEIKNGIFNNTCNVCGQTMKFDIEIDNVDNGKMFKYEQLKKVYCKSICIELQEIKEIQNKHYPKINYNDIDDLKIDIELFGKKNEV